MRREINILGGGPAGSCAALAAIAAGASVTVIERAQFPRHKVCGEFLSPEIEPELVRLGLWEEFLAAGPATVRRMVLHFGANQKEASLPQPAWGLSRYRFDHLLLERARAEGAGVMTEAGEARIDVLAAGRRVERTRRANRLFGFKTHFEGPVDDAVELFFFDGCYVGVSPVEGGRTNVCGLAPEQYLSRFDFDYDALAANSVALADRLRPLRRVMEWVSTGPLEFGQRFQPGETAYPAGDALSFVDPFTGSGLSAAVRSGAMAGRAAARSEPLEAYLTEVRASLKRPFQVASVLRSVVRNGWAEKLAPFAPARLLFALTRPR